MRVKFLCSLVAMGLTSTTIAHEITVQSGSLKGDVGPAVDFGVAIYKHEGYRIGTFTSPTFKGIVASYTSQKNPFIFEIGQREKSLEQGFLVSNGAYLPWTKNFAFAEPIGVRTGYQTKYLSFDSSYYQRDRVDVLGSRLHFTPISWFKFSGGAALQNLEQNNKALPIASLVFGSIDENHGFIAGVEYAGGENFLVHAQYGADFIFRAFAFSRSDQNPIASGIYGARDGVAAQFISEQWFAQFFSTDSRFGMLRYASAYLTAAMIYEEKVQLIGVSLRNNANGLHLRAGATIAADSSLQTLGGLGYADYIFLGGGHYSLYTDEPFESMIFPADWYSSILLQSTSMRIKDNGYKLLALINTELIRGFMAVTHSEDSRARDKFGFFMRISGTLAF